MQITVIQQLPQQGKILFFTDLDSKIWTANYDGTNASPVNVNIPNGLITNFGVPKLSPDQKKIFFGFYSYYGGKHYIYSCNLDGSNPQPLITESGDTVPIIRGAYYAGTQGKIFFQKINIQPINSPVELWTANLDGSGEQKINIILPGNCTYISSFSVAISPDGKSILFPATFDSYRSCIISCSINGGNATRITDPINSGIAAGFTYAIGNQQRIIYSNLFGGPGDVLTSNIDGSNTKLIPYGMPQGLELDSNPPAISPDGKTIFFNTITPQNKEGGIYSCHTDGSNVTQIFTVNSDFDSVDIGQVF